MLYIVRVVVVQVSHVLLAGNNDFGQVFKYGYASDGVHAQLLKLELGAVKPVKLIDLSQYHCVPLSAGFLHIGHYHRHRRIIIILYIFYLEVITRLFFISARISSPNVGYLYITQSNLYLFANESITLSAIIVY